MSIETPLICGLDEAGRGALAGPMVVAAVVFDEEFKFDQIAPDIVVRDSKQLSNNQREKAFDLIDQNCQFLAIEVMTVEEINRMGVGWANIEAFRRLINRVEAEHYIVDGRWRLDGLINRAGRVSCMIDADELVPSAMAAGIVAKYLRDQIMLRLHDDYPMYGWNTNTGHGTRQHIETIAEYGINEHHRIRFVRTALRNAGYSFSV